MAVGVAEAFFFDRGKDAGAEENGVEGFVEKILGAVRDALNGSGDLLGRGDDDDGHRAEGGVGFDDFQELEAVHTGHFEVEQDEVVVLARAKKRDGSGTVVRFVDGFKTDLAEVFRDREPDHAAVVDHEKFAGGQTAGAKNALSRKCRFGDFHPRGLLKKREAAEADSVFPITKRYLRGSRGGSRLGLRRSSGRGVGGWSGCGRRCP